MAARAAAHREQAPATEPGSGAADDASAQRPRHSFGGALKGGVGGTATATDEELRERRQRLASHRRELPIFACRERIVELVKARANVVVVGETGSGKTTQLPQYLLETGLAKSGRGGIAVTQPRRVAAVTVAQRVAEERGVRLGAEVGYSIRFEDVTSPSTRLKYLTDGMLLREAQIDPELKEYSVIVLDEAHERTLHTDVLFALVKHLQKTKRPDLKVVAMSATLQAPEFAAYFNNAEILHVPGRQFPVDVFFTAAPEQDYVDAAIIAVLQLHLDSPLEPKSDILVFLTGEEEIENTKDLLLDKVRLFPPRAPGLVVAPIYAALPPEVQMQAFQPPPPGSRKVILATNIAETSITIDGVRYVVDTGLTKVRSFNAYTSMDTLQVAPVSKAEARQRTGRAGRQQRGECYRLYTEETFLSLADFPVPEIRRCNLNSVVLQLKTLGIDDVLRFDFMDKPSVHALKRALFHLYALGALDDAGRVTRPLGAQIALFPLEPMFGRALLAAAHFGCAEEVLTIVAMLSVDSLFHSARGAARSVSGASGENFDAEETRAGKKMFASVEGDHFTLLRTYQGYSAIGRRSLSDWCKQHGLNMRALQQARKIRAQLATMYERLQLPLHSCGESVEPVKKALTWGFFLNAARRLPDKSYKTLLEGHIVHIHPSSVLFGTQPECVIYTESVHTSRFYLRDLTRIELAWLTEAAPRIYATADSSHRLDMRVGRVADSLSRPM